MSSDLSDLVALPWHRHGLPSTYLAGCPCPRCAWCREWADKPEQWREHPDNPLNRKAV